MTALLVALTLTLALVLGGKGWGRRLAPGGPDVAMASTACLAAIIVLTADIASIWRYALWMVLLLGALVILGGRFPRGRGMRIPWEHAPGRSSWKVLGLGTVALGLTVPLLIFPVPLDTDAQGFGYLALMIRDGGTIHTLAPWHPEISYLYSPGALLLFAALSDLFAAASMSAIMMGASHAAAFLFVWLASELGDELGIQTADAGGGGETVRSRERWRWATGASAALSVGLWTALLDSHYTAIFGLLLSLGCLTAVFRFKRTGRRIDAGLAALFLAAVAVTHPDMTIALALGLAAVVVLTGLTADRLPAKRWLVLAAGIPASAMFLVSPWLARLWPLLGAGVESPFSVSPYHWLVLTAYHGVLGPALALLGVAVYLSKRSLWTLAMVGWLALIVDGSTLGWVERAVPQLSSTLFRFDYPFSLAWHGPILPYLVLGAGALAYLGERLKVDVSSSGMRSFASAAVVASALFVVLREDLLQWSKGRLSLQGAFASANDVAAARWLRDHSSQDARVLNYPGDYPGGRDWEGHWAPVLSERDCIYFRLQPFLLPGPLDSVTAEQIAFLSFWEDPADPAHASKLEAAGVRYVLVPDAVGDPASLDRSWRWKPPALVPEARSVPADAVYLELVFQKGGAQVFQLRSTP